MDLLRKCLSETNIEYDEDCIVQFEKYYELLLSWNSKINLTSITEKEDVIKKHFVDSAILLKYYDLHSAYVLDIGTGAGFPGIPLKILCPKCTIVLLDSLHKRVDFLNNVIEEIGLTGISAECARAEDFARAEGYRERFDVVASRAVANLGTLSEYCLPFVNINGFFISYKGSNIDDEIKQADNAIKVLGGCIDRIENFTLPYSDIERSLIFIRKKNDTPDRFPRKAGTPSRKPL